VRAPPLDDAQHAAVGGPVEFVLPHNLPVHPPSPRVPHAQADHLQDGVERRDRLLAHVGTHVEAEHVLDDRAFPEQGVNEPISGFPGADGDRPPAVPERSTNLGLIGQYVEVPRDMAFTIECSVRSAWEAIYVLLKRGPAPPPVCQGQ